MALVINGVSPTEIKVVKNSTTTSLNIYEYSTKGSDLEEATRSSVSSYTSTQLNNWVGLQNDTWGAITNASSLIADRYYYIRVNVSDTGKTGKFCIRFKSASGNTITVDNMGWGYDGEVIYSTPVWGKPFSLSCPANTHQNTTLTVERTSSPNQHANTGVISNGAIIYYGDTLTISATPDSGYKIRSFLINDDDYGNNQTTTVTVNVTVTSSLVISVATYAAPVKTWHTVWTGSNTTVVTSSYSQVGGASDGKQNVSLSNFGTTGVDRETRITGNVVCAFSNTSYGSKTTNFSEKEVSSYTSWFTYYSHQVRTATVRSDAGVSYNSSNRTLTFYSSTSVSGNRPPNLVSGKATFTITKIEQYY
jgi:hypothetical protein